MISVKYFVLTDRWFSVSLWLSQPCTEVSDTEVLRSGSQVRLEGSQEEGKN